MTIFTDLDKSNFDETTSPDDGGNRTKLVGVESTRQTEVEGDDKENPYFLGFVADDDDEYMQQRKQNLRASFCSDDDYDDVLRCRRDVKFVTFNKSNNHSNPRRRSGIDGIFDDGITVPVRPARRRKSTRSWSDDRSFYEPEPDGVSTKSWSKYTCSEYTSNSTLSTVMLSSQESDSFTDSFDSKIRSSTGDEYESHMSLSMDELRSATELTSYRSISDPSECASNGESSYGQFHSLSSEYSWITSEDENVDDIAGLCRLSKSSTLLSSVERWILDIYFDAFDGRDVERIECEDKVLPIWKYDVELSRYERSTFGRVFESRI